MSIVLKINFKSGPGLTSTVCKCKGKRLGSFKCLSPLSKVGRASFPFLTKQSLKLTSDLLQGFKYEAKKTVGKCQLEQHSKLTNIRGTINNSH